MHPLSKRASALLEQFPGPVTIHYSKWLYAIVFALLVIGVVPIVSLVWQTWPRVLSNGLALAWLLVACCHAGLARTDARSLADQGAAKDPAEC
jgi:hypothetical protein